MLNQAAEKRRREILDATETCILRDGFSNISMEIIAKKVGCTRRTLYSYFPTRDGLFAKLFQRHALGANQLKVQKKIQGLQFEDALFHGLKYAIKLMRKNGIMQELIFGGGALWFQQQMLDEDSPIFHEVISINLEFWAPHLDEARKKGLLKENVTNQQLMKWYSTLQYIMLIRVKTTQAEADFVLKTFIIPSLVACKS